MSDCIYWLLFYEDPDVRAEMFTDREASERAHAHAQASVSWPVHLFCTVNFIADLERENAKLREELDAMSFVLKSAPLALEEAKRQIDQLRADLAAANARIMDLEHAWEEIFESRPVNGMSYTEAARALKAQLTAANERAERAEANVAKYATAARVIALNLHEFCNESLPYDEMIADAARKSAAQSDALRKALEDAVKVIEQQDFTYRSAVRVPPPRPKWVQDALTTVLRIALGQK